MSFTYESKPIMPGEFRSRLDELIAVRDAVNNANEPLEAELTATNAQIEVLRVKAMRLADQIDDNRGRKHWVALKKDIRILSAALSGKA